MTFEQHVLFLLNYQTWKVQSGRSWELCIEVRNLIRKLAT